MKLRLYNVIDITEGLLSLSLSLEGVYVLLFAYAYSI